MSNAYLTIYKPDGSANYKYGAVAGQWTRLLDKMQAESRTIGGDIDISMGSVFHRDTFILKCRATEDRSGYYLFWFLFWL